MNLIQHFVHANQSSLHLVEVLINVVELLIDVVKPLVRPAVQPHGSAVRPARLAAEEGQA